MVVYSMVHLLSRPTFRHLFQGDVVHCSSAQQFENTEISTSEWLSSYDDIGLGYGCKTRLDIILDFGCNSIVGAQRIMVACFITIM